MKDSISVKKIISSKKKLGEYLVEAGLIDAKMLAQALDVQKVEKKKLGRILIGLGMVNDKAIAKALAGQLHIPLILLKDIVIKKEIIALIPSELAETHLLIPIKETEDGILVAMSNPLDLLALEDLRFVTQKRIHIAIAPERDILRALEIYYPKKDLENDLASEPAIDDGIEIVRRKETEEKDLTNIQELLDLTERPPVIRFTNAIIADAIKLKASDIHIEPQKSSMIVRYRVDGIMREIMKTDRHIHASLVSRIKIISNMDISIRRKPQDGKAQVKYGGKSYDLRVSTIPTTYGETVSIRILNPDASKTSIEDFGLSDNAFKDFINAISKPQGMILVTGPTGSGKSSTLYACLNRLNNSAVHIITVEDPVEYDIDGINQVQINPAAGITFADGLRSILRQDPDIVMVGEIRDRETAHIACQAAQTGHLVFSTLHTNDAISTLTRLMDLGIEPFIISSSLIAVVGQRLVRKICPGCKVPDILSPQIISRLSPYLDKKKTISFWKGSGCEECNYSGYSGRLGVFEVLIITPSLREAISNSCTAEKIKKIVESAGFQPMSADGIRKALQGMTSIDEVFRVVPPEIEETSVKNISQHDSPAEPASEGASYPEPASSLGIARPLKILLVDDNEIILKILSGVLESEGYLIITAKNGLEALKLIMLEKPDLLITDYLMPEMDGVTLIKKLKSQLVTRYIPIIMLTSKEGEDAEVEGINAGADDYMTKPVNTKKLIARTNRLLKKRAVE